MVQRLRRHKHGIRNVQLVEYPSQVQQAGCQLNAFNGSLRPGKALIGRIAIHLQNAVITLQMAGYALPGLAVPEAVDDDGRITTAERPIVAHIGLEVRRLGLACSGCHALAVWIAWR